MALATLPEAEESTLQLFEEEFDTPDACYVDDNQAFGYVTHGPCRVNLCQKHYQKSKEFLNRAAALGNKLQCLICNKNNLTTSSFQLIKL